MDSIDSVESEDSTDSIDSIDFIDSIVSIDSIEYLFSGRGFAGATTYVMRWKTAIFGEFAFEK